MTSNFILKPEEVVKDRAARAASALAGVSAADYDNALEERLLEVRAARGYTTREPSDWKDSSVPRWMQDARDWAAFRDDVMLFGLAVQNEYEKTGVPPMSLDEFRRRLSEMNIEWTYKED